MASNASATAVDQTSGPTSDKDGRAPRGFWFIYFYGTEDGSEVKIGRTKQSPYLRRLQHETAGDHYQPMRTLAVVLGQVSDEGELRRHFAAFKSRARSKEWIRAGEEMRGYLRWLRSQSFVARNETELDGLTPVSSQLWLPEPGRAKNRAQLELLVEPDDVWSDLEVNHVAEGDYYTHPAIIEASRSTMGTIDLDPASCRDANEVIQAETFYSFKENGLLQEWRGRVWLNPPFGNWQEWVPKTLAEWHSGRIEQMCVLCESRVTTAKMFHPLVREADAVLIMCGRFAFWGPNASRADEGHAIFYFGDRVDAFARSFAFIGTVYRRNR